MDEKTFPDPRVRETIQKDFVPVRIDTTQDQETSNRYAVNGIPAIFVTDEKGQVVKQIIGFVPPDSFLEFLKQSLKG